jgi:hypothetical protein
LGDFDFAQSDRTGSSINSLSAGTYWVTVTDSLNNTASDTVTLIQPSVLGVSIDAHTFAGGTHISEHGAADGEMYSDVTGGIPPYQYDWNTGSHAEWTYKDRPAGAYTLVVTDAGGCQADADQTLTEPDVFTVDVQLTELQGGTHITCAGGSDGSASATPSGGIPPYTYDWATEDEDSLATDLPAGLQKVKVFDANGVKREVEFTLIAPDTITTTITTSALFPNGYHTSCHDCANATVTASATGGISPYEYQWLHTDYTTATIANAGEPYYELVVRDANGCKAMDKARLSIPERDDWSVNGNSGLNADSSLKWLGTNDNSDLLLKANNQPALRIGADGNLDVLGQLRLASPTQNSSNAAQLLVVDENGAVGAMEMDEIPDREPGGCFNEPSSINHGYWYSGENRVVVCPNVNVGVGVQFPVQRLQVSGNGLFSGKVAIGSNNEFTSQSILDIRGKTIIGYTEGIGPAYADANLDVRPDGDPARFTFETRDNGGRSSFRVRNNGKVIVGDGPYNDPASGTAYLYLGNESNSIRVASGSGMFFSTENSPNIMYLKDGAVRVGIGTQDPLTTFHIQDAQAKLRVGQSDKYLTIGYDGANSMLNSYGSNLLINYYNGHDVTFGSPSSGPGGGGGNISVRIYGDLTVCDKLNIVTNEFCDFVFDPGYKRMSFQDKEAYYRTNRHLIAMPPEKEILQNGLDVETIIKGLTLNVEELSLDQIDLYKMILELKAENAVLKQQMGELLKK